MKKNRGFTLMELMIVIAITLLLAVSITATLSVSTEKSKKTKAMAEMAEIATAFKMYYKDTGAWPYHIWHLLGPSCPKYPWSYTPYFGYTKYGTKWVYFDTSKWKGPYLQIFEYPLDPWGKNYVLNLDASESPYKLYIRATGSTPGGFDEDLKLFVHKFRPAP